MVRPPVPVTSILEPHAVLPERQPLFGRLAGTGTGTFWHVTDWHVNEFQPPDANAEDMCRTAAASASTEQPGSFGHPECDPTPAGWRAALAEMSSLQPAPDFIYAGGDWFGHVAKEHDTERAVRSSVEHKVARFGQLALRRLSARARPRLSGASAGLGQFAAWSALAGRPCHTGLAFAI